MGRRSLGLFAFGLLAQACGPAPAPAPAPAPPAPGPQPLALSSASAMPEPPPGPPGPLAFKPFDLSKDAPPRRMLIPQPTQIPMDDGKGTVEDGDEIALQDVLLGTAATGADKDKAIDADVDKVTDGVHLVIDSPYQIFSKAGSYIHVAAYQPNFGPASYARVFVDGKFRGKADATGTFVFRDVPDPKGGGGSHNVAVISGTGNGRLKGGANYNAYARTSSFERANLYVYTDRGVFSPGETVHVRAFAWRLRGDYRPFANASVNVILRREGKILSGGRIATDKLGIATLDLPLPGTAPEGSYELAVEHLGERATARLQIKRIVAPAVKIEHTLPRFLTRDAKLLGFDVKLADALGGAFKSGTINIRALDPKGTVVSAESRTVTGGGPHKFVLDEARLKKMRDDFADEQLAAVIIEVVDGATGRKDELRRDLRISRAPYRLVVETDRNEHVAGETIKIVVHATDLEHAPVVGHDVEVKMGDKKVVVKTDSGGAAKTTFIMPNGTSAYIEATLVEAKSVKGVAYVSASVPRAMFADVPLAMVKEREATPIEIRFPSKWSPTEKVVHADIVDSSGGLIHSFLVPIGKDQQGWLGKGTFPAPSWGSMLITFFAVGVENGNPNVGLLTDGANLPVRAARPLTVTLQSKSSALPGSSVEIGIKVERGFGKKKDARTTEVGVAVTDDAMLALLDPLERTPEAVLYNPERKVMASTGSQILTWPVVQKTWGAPVYDIALPPFGFRAGGVPIPVVIAKPAPKVTPPTVATKPGTTSGTVASGPDSDGDGIPDAIDKCPNEPETYNGYEDEDGCPDKGKVVISSSQIVIAPNASASAAAPAAGGKGMPAAPAPPPPPPSAADKPALLKTGEAGGKKLVAGYDEVNVSVRTDFAPTSLWLPQMILQPGADGIATAKVQAKLPDLIGTQRVTVVASDDRGSLGIGRATIAVSQDLSVRSDLPAVLTQGDEIEVSVAVRNTKSDAATGNVTLSSSMMAIVGPSTQPITVPPNALAAVKFKVRADQAGRVPYTVSFLETRGPGSTATGPLRDDTEKRLLWCTPRGAPATSHVKAKLASNQPWVFSIDRDKNDTHVEAELAIAFPSAVPLIEGLEELVDEGNYMGVDPDASRLLAGIAIEGYLVRTKASAATIARVHERLQHAATALLLEQQQDGGFGWRWDTWAAYNGLGSGSSAYVTTHALTALTKLRDTDIPVPEASIASARSYILRSLDQSDQVDVSNVAFWEGEGPHKNRAATMAAFQAVALSEKVQKPYGKELETIGRLRKMAVAIVKGGPGSEDPLTLSSAVMGIYLHARAINDQSAETKDVIMQGAKALVAGYRGGYWEPSWFHAYGGRLEATRGVIELLTTISPGAYDVELHDAVDYLIATRASWGEWHNAWGTAAAIEALTFLDPTPKEKAGAKVVIAVDGAIVRTIAIDPNDPFTSAASLRSIDLSAYLPPGKHEVRVGYDGTLEVPATMVVRRWSPATKVEGLGLKIERALSATTIDLGKSIEAKIKVTTTAPRPETIVEVPLGAALESDPKALEPLVKAGTIASFRESKGVLYVSLVQLKGTQEIKLPLRAKKRGSFFLPAASAWAPRSTAEGWSTETKLVVK